MKLKLCIVILTMIVLTGCVTTEEQATINQDIVTAFEADAKNWRIIPQIADQLIPVWPIKSAVLKTLFSDAQIWHKDVLMVQDLDKLCALETPTDTDKAMIAVLHLRLSISLADQVIEILAPDILSRLLTLIPAGVL